MAPNIPKPPPPDVDPPKPPLLGFVGVAPIDIDAFEVLGDAPALCPNPVNPPAPELPPKANGELDEDAPAEGLAPDPKPAKPVAPGAAVAAGVLEPNPNEGAAVGAVVADPNAKGLGAADAALAAGDVIEKPDVLEAPNPPNPVLAGAAAAADVAGALAPKVNVGAVDAGMVVGFTPNVVDGLESENIEDPVAGALVVAALAAGIPNRVEPNGAGVVVLPNNEGVAGFAGEVADEAPPNIDEVDVGAADDTLPNKEGEADDAPPNKGGVDVVEVPKAGAGVDVAVTPNAGAAAVVEEAPKSGAEVAAVVVAALADPAPNRLAPEVAAGFAPNKGAPVLAGMENSGVVGVVGAVDVEGAPNENIGAVVGLDAARVNAGAGGFDPKREDDASAEAEVAAAEVAGRAKGFAMGAIVDAKGLLTGAVVGLTESDVVAVGVGMENRLGALDVSPPVLAAEVNPNKLPAGFVSAVAGVAAGALKTNPPGAAAAGVVAEEAASVEVGLAAGGANRFNAGAALALEADVDEGCPNENMAGAAEGAGLAVGVTDDDGAPKPNSAGAAGFDSEDDEAAASANMFGAAAAALGFAPGLGVSQAPHLSSASRL